MALQLVFKHQIPAPSQLQPRMGDFNNQEASTPRRQKVQEDYQNRVHKSKGYQPGTAFLIRGELLLNKKTSDPCLLEGE